MSGQPNAHNGFQDKRLDRLESDVSTIKDNHLAHLATQLAGVKVDVTGVKTDVSWLKQSFWKIGITGAFAAIGVLIQIVLSLTIK